MNSDIIKLCPICGGQMQPKTFPPTESKPESSSFSTTASGWAYMPSGEFEYCPKCGYLEAVSDV